MQGILNRSIGLAYAVFLLGVSISERVLASNQENIFRTILGSNISSTASTLFSLRCLDSFLCYAQCNMISHWLSSSQISTWAICTIRVFLAQLVYNSSIANESLLLYQKRINGLVTGGKQMSQISNWNIFFFTVGVNRNWNADVDMDELRVFNRSLTAVEVFADYKSDGSIAAFACSIINF